MQGCITAIHYLPFHHLVGWSSTPTLCKKLRIGQTSTIVYNEACGTGLDPKSRVQDPIWNYRKNIHLSKVTTLVIVAPGPRALWLGAQWALGSGPGAWGPGSGALQPEGSEPRARRVSLDFVIILGHLVFEWLHDQH